ncbi:MAG: glycine--tRNA ligase [Armatimonadetes bacterium CG2_30_59_28]|nr:glycine--tRNA ligase [Armatimonadota bacterium]OIO98116.1 MAG: glycine--tRNA ligase [Armatimonadetes bacterium CG2_30_59_28]PIU63591.1 MAG: glycine--tRNA ligase [Armatimonadetes bacterium CG07_land_8_20_14_0_80_59_28]PIX42497.1 MAG: glycine--tRNA ligase [Armatimonadetes bacterium CG_4_8_14_3_um_filter_58_9]PIY42421.1 MAG: glycine--tRNA ligase [Armatimonadetes bacterium CG_4_10_14_3_um_filter_59_10]
MPDMETIVSLCKRRGFIFQSSEVYGGFSSCWDYGPLGVELKNNVKRAWWKSVVQMREDMVGLDGSILMHPRIWEASGHVANFNDPMVDCRACKLRFRADQVDPNEKCPETKGPHDLTEARQFNMMFKTHVGAVADDAAVAYLRPETAQAIFVNFLNVQATMRKKLPFGIAQIGKAFRNEITPGNFTFRTREFEQMEIEYFVKPGTDEEWHERWIADRKQWYLELGIKEDNLRIREHEPDELAHYARRCADIEYNFPIGWSELEGIANRTDFDLKQHSEHSGKDLTWFDPETNEHVMPYVIEPSGGVDRATLAFLVDAYDEETVRDRKRVVLRLHKDLAPLKVAVLPLLRNRPEIVEMARKIADDLRPHVSCMYDDTAAIGKLYRRQDEIGTLYCVTVDVDSLEDKQVTVRERDSMEQVRVPVSEVVGVLREKVLG